VSFLGLGMKVADYRSQKPNQKCERCGLLYPKDEDECIHCGKLGEVELNTLKEKILNDAESANNLGRVFFMLALVVIAIFTIGFMA